MEWSLCSAPIAYAVVLQTLTMPGIDVYRVGLGKVLLVLVSQYIIFLYDFLGLQTFL